MATFKIKINIPQTAFDGWTGHLVSPNGTKIPVRRLIGGAPVSFDSKEQFVKAATAAARRAVAA